MSEIARAKYLRISNPGHRIDRPQKGGTDEADHAEEPHMSANRPMFAATEALRTRRTRTGSIGGLTLPRTVEIVVLVSGGLGFFIGMFGGLILGGGMEGAVWGGAFGAATAVALVKFEPIRHHSLYKYIRLWMAARKGRAIVYNGRRVRAAIGIAVIEQGPGGPIEVIPGAVDINPNAYDERGVLRKDPARRRKQGDLPIPPMSDTTPWGTPPGYEPTVTGMPNVPGGVPHRPGGGGDAGREGRREIPIPLD